MLQSEEKKQHILVIGNGGVGKTTYIMKKLGRQVTRKYIPTHGIHSYEKDNTVWYDFPGQERYGSHNKYITESNCTENMDIDMDLVIYMYDVTNELSEKSLVGWKGYVKRVFGKKDSRVIDSITIPYKTEKL
jgi:GTPase SAR1 family protein